MRRLRPGGDGSSPPPGLGVRVGIFLRLRVPSSRERAARLIHDVWCYDYVVSGLLCLSTQMLHGHSPIQSQSTTPATQGASETASVALVLGHHLSLLSESVSGVT